MNATQGSLKDFPAPQGLYHPGPLTRSDLAVICISATINLFITESVKHWPLRGLLSRDRRVT